MVGTILPVVYGTRRKKLLTLYTAASTVGSAVMGGCIGVLGVGISRIPQLQDSAGTLTSAVLLICGAIDMKLLPFGLPQFKTQVPHAWRFWRAETMIPSYGFTLGLGFGTRIPTASVYAVATYCLMCGDLGNA